MDTPRATADVVIVADHPHQVSRAPSDVLRVVVGVVALLIVVVIGLLFGDGVVAFTADLLRGLDQLPSWLMTGIGVLAQVTIVGLIVLAVVEAVMARSGRQVLAALIAVVVGAALAALLSKLIDDHASQVTHLTEVGIAGKGGVWPAALLGGLTALIAAVSPWTARRWRRLGWVGICCVAITLFVAAPVAFGTLVGVLAGWVVGSATVVIFGAPSLRPTGAAIAAGLEAVGVPLARLEQVSLDARGSTPYFGETTSGQKLFVKALGEDERSADLMFRMYRWVQRNDLGDERPFSSLRRAVEHEALVSLVARDLGVRTPHLVAVSPAGPGGFALAYEAVKGRSLDRVDPNEFTDDMLDGVWAHLAVLRAHRVAHRDLRLANVFLADDGALWMIDFGFSEVAASDLLLATDLAELIGSSSVMVGADRAVAASVRGVGPEATSTALDRLRLPLLSGATRTAMKADAALLPAVRTAVAHQAAAAGSPQE